MANLRHDFALRRSLVKLKAFSEEDFAAVLDSLDDGQRARALALLAELDGSVGPEVEMQEGLSIHPVSMPKGLSPWLVARINGRGEAGDETADHFDLTPHAHLNLRKLAVELAPDADGPPRGRSLFGQLWRRKP